MKALFVSLYADTPHFETELELISDLLEEGTEVVVMRCTGQLGACLKNPDHRAGWCKLCISKLDGGFAAIASPRLRIETMPVGVPDPRLPETFESAEALKAYALDGAQLGRGVYSTMAGRAGKNTQFDPQKFAATIRTELEAAYAVYTATREAITRHRPERVFIFNGRFATCHAVIEACKQEGVAFATHERGGSPDRYLVRHGALPHDLALNCAEIEATWKAGASDKEAIAAQWFQDRRDGVERSWESFTKAQTVGKLPDGFDQAKHNIAVFNSTMEEYASIEGWESPIYADEVVGVTRIADALASHANTHLYLRVHPHLKGISRDDNYQLRAYTKLERHPHVTVIWPESPVHTYELLDRCSVALTFGSTVGVEACFWGRPSVLAGHALYERLDCAHVPKTHDEVMALLTGKPRPKDRLGALQYGYWETVRGTTFTRFRPIGLYGGEWLGRPSRPSRLAQLQSAVLTRLGR